MYFELWVIVVLLGPEARNDGGSLKKLYSLSDKL